MRLTNYIFALLLVLISSVSVFGGGGWPQKKGEAYIKLSEWFIIASEHYTSQGQIDPNQTAGLYNTTLYAEYGVTDRFTVVVNFPFFSRGVLNNIISSTNGATIVEGDAINGVGDIDFTLKYGIFQSEKIAISASFVAGLAIGQSAGGRDANIQLGDGEYNQMLRLDFGIPFNVSNASLYANLYGAYNNRTNGFSDEIRFGGEIGAGLVKDKLWLVAKADAVQSTFNGDRAEATASIFANNAEFFMFTAEVSYEFTENFGISFAFGTPLSGRIVYAAPSYSFGFYSKF